MDRFRAKISIGISFIGLVFWLSMAEGSGRVWGAIPFAAFVYIFCYFVGRWRIALFGSFMVYHLGALGFTYLVDGHLDLLGLLKYIPSFKYIAFFGIVMILLDIAWYYFDARENKQEKELLNDENTTLKAKLYDLQESKKADESKKS